MSRDHLEYPRDIKVDTAYGQVELAVTDGEHVHASSVQLGGLTVAGRNYNVSVHLNTYDGGKTWELTKDKSGSTRDSVYAKKADWTNYNDSDMPPSYREKAVREVTAKVAAYLAAHPEVVRRAALAHASNELAAAERQLRELREKVEEQAAIVEQKWRALHAIERAS